MRYSEQQFFCNCCGKEMLCNINQMMGGKFLGFRVCSSKCVREIRWRETLSIMGKEYYPDPTAEYKDD
jgi:hypothetical protein